MGNRSKKNGHGRLPEMTIDKPLVVFMYLNLLYILCTILNLCPAILNEDVSPLHLGFSFQSKSKYLRVCLLLTLYVIKIAATYVRIC